MPNPLDYLKSLYLGDMPRVGSPEGSRSVLPVPGVPRVRDERDVASTRRLGLPKGGSTTLSSMGKAAHSMGINPDIAASLALTEGDRDYGMSSFPPMAAYTGEMTNDDFQQLRAEQALRHLRERASAVGGPLTRQLQGYNGMGKLPAGHYGQDEIINAGKDLPYGNRVMDVKRNILKVSPEVDALIHSSNSTAVSPLAPTDWMFADEIAKDLNIRRRKPNLLRED